MKKPILSERDPAMATCRAKIQGFLDFVEGTFRLRDVYEALGANTTEEKATVRQGLRREKQAGSIENTSAYGTWRKVDSRIQILDLSVVNSNGPERFSVEQPLGLENLVPTYPGDLHVVAGRTNAGKSSFALELSLMNIGRQLITYLSSELTREQIQERARISGIGLEGLKDLRFAMRYENFQDVIDGEDGIYIIDYLAAPGSGDDPAYYKIPHLIGKIHEKLNGTGLVLLLLQKDPGKASGEGGFKTLHRANLYLTLDKDEHGRYWANIQKCKARSTLEGYRIQYKPKSFGLVAVSDWIPPERGY